MGIRFEGWFLLLAPTVVILAFLDVSQGYVVGRLDSDDTLQVEPMMDHGGGGHGNDTPPATDHHSMKMYFHASAMSTILFENWMTHSWQQMLGSCVGLFFIAVFYEGLKIGRELLMKKMNPIHRNESEVYAVSVIKTTETSDCDAHSSKQRIIGNETSVGSRIFNISHIIQTLLHFVQVWLSFCLMLVFMTFNIWLCLAVTLGAAAGYFSFAWLKSSTLDVNEHCN